MDKTFVVYLPNNKSKNFLKYDNIKVHIKIRTQKLLFQLFLTLFLLGHIFCTWFILIPWYTYNAIIISARTTTFIIYLKASCSFSLLLCWCRFNCFLSKQLQLLFSCFAAVAKNTTGIAATFIIIHK